MRLAWVCSFALLYFAHLHARLMPMRRAPGPSQFLRESLAAVGKRPGGELEEGGARAGFAGHFLPMARPVFDAVGMSPDATSY